VNPVQHSYQTFHIVFIRRRSKERAVKNKQSPEYEKVTSVFFPFSVLRFPEAGGVGFNVFQVDFLGGLVPARCWQLDLWISAMVRFEFQSTDQETNVATGKEREMARKMEKHGRRAGKNMNPEAIKKMLGPGNHGGARRESEQSTEHC
jgi:hypothetical protein